MIQDTPTVTKPTLGWSYFKLGVPKPGNTGRCGEEVDVTSLAGKSVKIQGLSVSRYRETILYQSPYPVHSSMPEQQHADGHKLPNIFTPMKKQ